MKSLDEIATARAAFAETADRIKRFAWGANRSERYATELHAWLAARHADNARFSDEHHRAAVPTWWPGAEVLDRVPMALLEHSPEFLERALRLDSV